jgi:hypothetical protein
MNGFSVADIGNGVDLLRRGMTIVRQWRGLSWTSPPPLLSSNISLMYNPFKYVNRGPLFFNQK